MLVVWRLSTILPQDSSSHNFMSFSTMISQLFPTRDSTISVNRDHTDLQLADDPVLDPHAIVTGIQKKSAPRSNQSTDSKKQLQTSKLPYQMAASER